jgi:hypothetical protein
MTEDAFADMFSSDPAGAMQEFIEGLGTLELKDQVAALDALGIRGRRARDAFLGLAGNTELMAQALDLAGEAIEGNGALMDEASKRAETTAGQMNKLKNNISVALNEIGSILLPIVNDIISEITRLVQEFIALPTPVKESILKIVGAIALIGPIIFVFGGIVSAVGMLISAFGSLVGIVGTIASGFAALVAFLPTLGAGFAFLLSPIGILIAAFALFLAGLWLVVNNLPAIHAALVGFADSLGNKWDDLARRTENNNETWAANFKMLGVIIQRGATNLVGQFQELAINIGKAFQVLPTILLDVGRLVMQGLIDGVKQKLVEFIALLRDIAVRGQNAVRNAFGIASPSKVMAKMGEQVVAGFHQGIEGMGGIGVNVPQLAGAGRQPALAVGGAGASMGGGVSIVIENLNVPPGTTREQVEIIARQLGKMVKQNGGRNIL